MLLTDRQRTRLETVFAAEEHMAVETTWFAYQLIIAAYADHDRERGKKLLASVIDDLRVGLPAGLEELAQLGRTLHRRRADVLAYFSHRASNGPTEAINGRLEALRRNALGFRNLVNYRIRSLLHWSPRTLISEEPLITASHAAKATRRQGSCFDGVLLHSANDRVTGRIAGEECPQLPARLTSVPHT